jgi:hypothetical protein
LLDALALRRVPTPFFRLRADEALDRKVTGSARFALRTCDIADRPADVVMSGADAVRSA